MKNPDVLLMISPCAIFHGYIPLYPAIFYLYISLFSSFFLVKFTFIDTSHLTRPSRHPSLSEADSPSARAHRCLAALVVADWGSSASMLISIDVPKRPDLGLHISFNIPPIFRYPNPYIYIWIYIYIWPMYHSIGFQGRFAALAETSGSLTAHSINLIDEDDAGSILLGLIWDPEIS